MRTCPSACSQSQDPYDQRQPRKMLHQNLALLSGEDGLLGRHLDIEFGPLHELECYAICAGRIGDGCQKQHQDNHQTVGPLQNPSSFHLTSPLFTSAVRRVPPDTTQGANLRLFARLWSGSPPPHEAHSSQHPKQRQAQNPPQPAATLQGLRSLASSRHSHSR